MQIVLATGNRGKVREIKEFFKNYDVVAYSDLIQPFEIIENGESFKQNAIIKAKAVYKKLPGNIVLADDSGISVNVLDGRPGIYSARYAGVNASDRDNLYKLINELKKRKIKKTPAFYTAAVAVATPYGVYSAHGIMRGDVIDEARGNNGFGYDPMFIPKGFDKTLGELEDDVKKEFSHRTKALRLIKLILKVIQK